MNKEKKLQWIPSNVIFLILWLLQSQTNKDPSDSECVIPVGYLNWASSAIPSLNPLFPLPMDLTFPAFVCEKMFQKIIEIGTIPVFNSIILILWFPASQTNKQSWNWLKQTDLGQHNNASIPFPSANPGKEDFPAIVVTMPWWWW